MVVMSAGSCGLVFAAMGYTTAFLLGLARRHIAIAPSGFLALVPARRTAGAGAGMIPVAALAVMLVAVLISLAAMLVAVAIGLTTMLVTVMIFVLVALISLVTLPFTLAAFRKGWCRDQSEAQEGDGP